MDKQKVIYILGPMRGYPNLNFAEFNKYAQALEISGWIVFNPALNPMNLKSLKAYMMIDLAALFECDAVLRLKGWEESKGAKVENALAEYLDLEIIDV